MAKHAPIHAAEASTLRPQDPLQAPPLPLHHTAQALATWLAPDLLLVVTPQPPDSHPELRATLIAEGTSRPLIARSMTFRTSDRADAPHDHRVSLVRLPRGLRARRAHANLALGSADPCLVLDLQHSTIDLQTLTRRAFAGLPAHIRADIMRFVLSASASSLRHAEKLQLHKNLHLLREALREHYPYSLAAPDQAIGLGIDSILAIDEQSFYVKGWLRNDDAQVKGLTAISPEGVRVHILERMFTYEHHDSLTGRAGGSTGETGTVGYLCFFTVRT